MNPIRATYFDGLTAQARTVELSLLAEASGSIWRVRGDSFEVSHSTTSTRLAPAVGSARRFLHFPDGSCCETEDHSGLDAALPQEAGGWRRKLDHQPITLAVITVLLAAGAVWGFQWMLPHLAQRVADAVPPSVERRLGRGTLRTLDENQFLQHGFTISDRREQLRSRLDELVRQSGHTGPVNLQFRRLYDGSANAFALPDGTIILTDQLIEIAADNDEVLAVLAHEIGHLHHRHSLRQLLQNSISLLLVTSLTGDTSALGNFGGALPLAVLSAKYSRDHEREADAFALNALLKAGIPPGAFINAMNRIEQHNRNIYKDQPAALLSTHPPTEERLESYRKAGDAAGAP